jgi:hypothetical protein
MPEERWGPSRGLRIVVGVQGIINVGLSYVLLWFFFPHALLVPVLAAAVVLCLAGCIQPLRVVLDPERGELAITQAFWTRHVLLTRVTRVDTTERLGAEIAVGSGWSYGIRPFAHRRLLTAFLRPRLRTGFEGMETAVTRAAAVARGADPDSPLPGKNGSVRSIGDACLLAAAGLLYLVVAALVRPQTGGRLVHDAALVLRTLAGLAGAVVLLIGICMLFRAWRDQHAAGQPGQRPGQPG